MVLPAPVHFGQSTVESGLESGPSGCPGGVGCDPDAAPVVGLPGHSPAELLGPVAREDQVGVGVHEPGQHAAAARVEALIGGGSGRTHRHHGVAVDDDGRAGDHPERAVPQRGVVGDQLADVVDHQRRHDTTS